VIHTGKLKHFTPENDIYTYFRYNEEETIMVVLNKNKSDAVLPTERFSEVMKGYTSGTILLHREIFRFD
jgi:neopullulanase